MRLDLYLKRQKLTISQLVNIINAQTYDDLLNHCKSIGIKCLPEEQIDYEFENDVEERTVIKSGDQEGRISDQKSSKPTSDDRSSIRRSEAKQRIRKSTTQRKRKSDSDQMESVQPISGSESSK